MNRLTDATYIKPDASFPLTNAYNESIKYDKNGNIMRLERYGNQDDDSPSVNPKKIDDLIYDYMPNSNQLLKVTDTEASTLGFNDGANDSQEYVYDGQGNLIRDNNKKIALITYNHLNLPTLIRFASGATINYLYNAVGVKISKVVRGPNGVDQTDYLDGFQYQNGRLQFFPTAEGYVDATNSAYKYAFQYKDHLGNIRVSYTQNGSTLKILEENHYYPFGLKHERYNSAIFDYILTGGTSALSNVARSKNQFKYNGQEFQDELELNMTAMDFRQYDNALGRFHGVDALAELAPSMTPYRFGFNNPVYWNDPTGLFESWQSAINHMLSNNMSGSIISNTNGTFSICSNTGGEFYRDTYTMENGVVEWSMGTGAGGASNAASSGNSSGFASGFGSSNNGGLSSGVGSPSGNSSSGGSGGSGANINNVNIGWISQYNNKVPDAGDFACKRACYLMMQNSGFNPMRGMVNGFHIAVESGGTIRATPNMSDGINYLNEQLRTGNPVIVGVARDLDGYRTKNLNGDRTTDHFIIIYGMQNGEYIFLDPGTRNSASGASPNNLLILLNGIYRGNRSGQNYNLMLSWIGKNY